MAEATVRVAFWNTWLLYPRLWGGPHPPKADRVAPHVSERAPLVGAAIAGRFDVVALAEVFEQSEQETVAEAWPEAKMTVGPMRRAIKPTGSGLCTLVDPAVVEVVDVARRHYRTGGDLRDSDTFASKGVLFTRLRLGEGIELDLFSTHLIAGGELLPIRGHDDTVRHHVGRMSQLGELLAFVAAERNPANPALIVGDFNVPVHDPEPRLDHDTERYEELRNAMEAAGFADQWAQYGVGPGHTCSFAAATDLPADPSEPDAVLDDPDTDPRAIAGERIDFFWLSVPAGVTVEVERPRRWAFPGRGVRGGPAGSLSDHLALSATLHLRHAAVVPRSGGATDASSTPAVPRPA
jgi:endonuclease/exonuclease/phosphatase family metal-dependent hydrolase